MIRLVLRGLRARRLRTALTALAVVSGVAMISGTYILTDTIDKSFKDIFATANATTDVSVSPRDVSDAFDADPPPLDERLVARVRQTPGVAKTSGSVFSQVSIRDKDGHRIGKGVPSFAASVEPAPFNAFHTVTGRMPRTPTEVALDRHTAKDQHFKLGDRVTIVGEPGARQFTLVGTARFGDVDSLAGAPVALMQLPVAQALTDRVGKLDAISVQAAPGVSRVELRDRVRHELAGAPVTVRTGQDEADHQASDLHDQFSFLRIALLVFAGIALFVGAFVIYNTFSITVAQRTRELGLLRALGASRRQVLRSVVLEAVFVGLLASLLGLAAGLGLAPGLRGLISTFGGDLPSTGLVVATRTIVVSIVVGVVVTVVASLVPALRATRIPPVAALREGLTAAPRGGRRRLVVAVVLSLAGIGVLLAGLFGGSSGGSAAAQMGIGAVVIFLGVALLSPQLVRPLASAVGAPLERLAGLTGRLARENSTRNPGRTAVTASALMIGVTLVAFVSIFAAGLRSSIDRSVDRSFGGDLTITNSSGFDAVPATVARAVGAVPGVAAVSSVRFSQAKVAGKKGTTFVAGIDPATVAQTYKIKWRKGSDASALTQLGNDGALIDKHYGGSHRVGDRLHLFTPAGRHVTYTVRGFLDEGNFGLLGGGLVVANRNLARDFNDRDDDFVMLRYAHGADGHTVRASIDHLLDTRFPIAESQNRSELKDDQAGQINQLLYMIYALLALSVIVSLFGIVNTLALSIFERTRELGLLRAVGASRRQVKRVIRLEAVITSLIGAVLGVVLGVLFAIVISRPLADDGFTLSFPIGTLAIVVVGAAAAGAIAAIAPARRAARLDVLDALSYE